MCCILNALCGVLIALCGVLIALCCILNALCRVLIALCCILNALCRVLIALSGVLGAMCGILSALCDVLRVQCGVLSALCGVLGAMCDILSALRGVLFVKDVCGVVVMKPDGVIRYLNFESCSPSISFLPPCSHYLHLLNLVCCHFPFFSSQLLLCTSFSDISLLFLFLLSLSYFPYPLLLLLYYFSFLRFTSSYSSWAFFHSYINVLTCNFYSYLLCSWCSGMFRWYVIDFGWNIRYWLKKQKKVFFTMQYALSKDTCRLARGRENQGGATSY